MMVYKVNITEYFVEFLFVLNIVHGSLAVAWELGDLRGGAHMNRATILKCFLVMVN